MDQDLQYHRERAMAELDRAINADSFIVAEAHFRLSSLHLKRAEKLRDSLPAAAIEDQPARLFVF